MAQIVIPPWLNTNPAESVTQMLHGYGLGLQASEAQAANAARAQQQALAQQQAAELNAYRQQEQALADRKFTEELRLQQAKAQREAADAAQQLQGMQELQRRTGAGEPFEKVWPDVAPKILVRHPQSLAQSIERLLPAQPPTFSKGPGGIDIMQGPSGAPQAIPPRYTDLPHVPRVMDIGGVSMVETSQGHWAPLHQQAEGTITQAGRAKLQELSRDEARIYKTWGDITDEDAAKDPEAAKALDQIDQIQTQRQSIYSGTWKPTAPTGATLPTVTTKAQFDALPPGSMYIGKDGRQYRKP